MRMSPRAFAVVVVALLVCPRPAPADNAADVRAAAKAFYESVSRPDVNACLALTDGFAAERPAILAWHAARQAELRLGEALDARFPDPAGHPDPLSVMKPEYVPALALMKVAVRGDNASVYAPGESPTTGVRFKRVNGAWKFHCMTHPHTDAEMVEKLRRFAKATAETADGVKQGRFVAVRDAYVDRFDRMFPNPFGDDAPAEPRPRKK